MADVFSIASALKRKGITQREVVEALSEKYHITMSESNFNAYAQKYWCGDTPVWNAIKECLEKEFGIIYKPSYWT
jgi:uncharacterized protein YlxP (DUF503 family)